METQADFEPIVFPNRPRHRLAWLGWVVGALVLAALMYGIYLVNLLRRDSGSSSCLSNVQSAARGALAYSADWDDRLPPAHRWMDVFETSESFRCTAVAEDAKVGQAYGLAFNERLGSKVVADFQDPNRLPLIFDSTLNERNAASGLETLPTPGRHYRDEPANAIGFLDGHAALVPDSKRSEMIKP